MKLDEYYLTERNAIDQAVLDTDMTESEIEEIVGRFKDNHHRWAGKLKGQVWLYDDKVQIRHHFSKKILWQGAVY